MRLEARIANDNLGKDVIERLQWRYRLRLECNNSDLERIEQSKVYSFSV